MDSGSSGQQSVRFRPLVSEPLKRDQFGINIDLLKYCRDLLANGLRQETDKTIHRLQKSEEEACL